MKNIIAEKVKDGWQVKITETHHIHSESDVYKFAKQNGMKIRNKVTTDKYEIVSMSGD